MVDVVFMIEVVSMDSVMVDMMVNLDLGLWVDGLVKGFGMMGMVASKAMVMPFETWDQPQTFCHPGYLANEGVAPRGLFSGMVQISRSLVVKLGFDVPGLGGDEGGVVVFIR